MKILNALFIGTAAVALIAAADARAEWPEKPIQFIIPFGAGGGADIEGRLIAKAMSGVLGQPVVPINKPGGGGAITYTFVKNSAPDGYTVAWNSTSVLTTTNIGNVPFDYTALEHIGQVAQQPVPFVVKKNARWNTLKAFMDECKAKPNTLKVAFAGFGSATHMAGVAMTQLSGCKAIMLPVKGPDRRKMILSGETDAAVDIFFVPLKFVKAGKMKFLAISSGKRNPAAPNVPTAKELGLDMEFDLFRGLSVAKGTPQAIKDKLEGAMIKAANSKAFAGRMKKLKLTLAPMGQAQFNAKLAKANANIVAIMKKAGIYKSKMKK
ncbi:MAG: tripartite tricarboxylate transporter substrate binding protein [Rhodospirillaceae bacterium]|jgi:tripartite-type tricarboxylate transporter receptor subunit TctC|nr:tripartite tricarboxylate transporter substrate binding protein [Rhodospirillaceae bacterium]MBT4674408.1 tripartite tricarboxylate transporter substrate binding protein [Rhodospirillaceae bacterium]MBT4718744.1 tripartite tricarboxylate transporter substrate binding protein [Rhodospirillaceae bacterium]MBT4748554.1 tripartite tricarboxylate transporter substrate binding protein [Rhodospirillaceae bacterium]MBT5180860.1 tripartite tricarboxylate transporter substrate binding protein [Rhodosp